MGRASELLEGIMKISISGWSVFCGLVIMGAAAGTRADWQGKVAADFDVSVTMDSFTGHATGETFVVSENAPEAKADLRIDQMFTGDKKRDKAMGKMFKSDQFPLISGTAPTAWMSEWGTNSAATGSFPVRLVISGQTNTVSAWASHIKTSDNQRSFDAAFDVSLKAFGLKAPSMMLGAISVHDVVKVTSHVTLTKCEHAGKT